MACGSPDDPGIDNAWDNSSGQRGAFDSGTPLPVVPGRLRGGPLQVRIGPGRLWVGIKAGARVRVFPGEGFLPGPLEACLEIVIAKLRFRKRW